MSLENVSHNTIENLMMKEALVNTSSYQTSCFSIPKNLYCSTIYFALHINFDRTS